MVESGQIDGDREVEREVSSESTDDSQGKVTREFVATVDRTPMYEALVDKPGVFKPVMIPSGNAENCRKKKVRWTDNSMRRVFYLPSELPANAKMFDIKDLPVRCLHPGCPRRVNDLIALRSHLMGFHSEAYEALYKDAIESRLKKMSELILAELDAALAPTAVA